MMEPEPHPGEILFVDLAEGTQERRPVASVPESIAWVQTPRGRKAVVRIEITTLEDTRSIRAFGADGELLRHTLQEA